MYASSASTMTMNTQTQKVQRKRSLLLAPECLDVRNGGCQRECPSGVNDEGSTDSDKKRPGESLDGLRGEDRGPIGALLCSFSQLVRRSILVRAARLDSIDGWI